MVTKQLIINSTVYETRVALIEGGQVSEYYIERSGDRGIVGNIYKGKVIRVLPGMQSCFVDIGLGLDLVQFRWPHLVIDHKLEIDCQYHSVAAKHLEEPVVGPLFPERPGMQFLFGLCWLDSELCS